MDKTVEERLSAVEGVAEGGILASHLILDRVEAVEAALQINRVTLEVARIGFEGMMNKIKTLESQVAELNARLPSAK